MSRNSSEARRLVIAKTTAEDKTWYLQDQIYEKRSKHPNRTVNQQAFVTTIKLCNYIVILDFFLCNISSTKIAILLSPIGSYIVYVTIF